MDFSAFDRTRQEAYAAEARKRWGQTNAYQEFEEKTAGQSQPQQDAAAQGLMAIFTRLGAIRTSSPASFQAQSLIRELQEYITANYYTCTNQILRGLGMMYIAGDDMTANIDAAGGEGTARFVREAIEIYCK